MRVAQPAQEFEVLARIEEIGRARQIIKARRNKAYDPELVDLVLDAGAGWWDAVEPVGCWDAALAVAPPSVALDAVGVDESPLVLADFADLKSPWTSGHSRAVAALALEACGPSRGNVAGQVLPGRRDRPRPRTRWLTHRVRRRPTCARGAGGHTLQRRVRRRSCHRAHGEPSCRPRRAVGSIVRQRPAGTAASTSNSLGRTTNDIIHRSCSVIAPGRTFRLDAALRMREGGSQRLRSAVHRGMAARAEDSFDADRLVGAAIVTTLVAVPLAFISTTIGVVVVVCLAFVCARVGGRDAGLGSAGAGTFMFFWAATKPHFQFEIASSRDVVLLIVCFFGSLLAQEMGTRLYRRKHARPPMVRPPR